MKLLNILITLGIVFVVGCSTGETAPQSESAEVASNLTPAGSLSLLPPGVGLPPTGDEDGDGVLNAVDNCPFDGNAPDVDADGDGVGDVQSDLDRDGVGDPCDNCPSVPNTNQKDADDNGLGDACEEGAPSSPPEPVPPDLAPLI